MEPRQQAEPRRLAEPRATSPASRRATSRSRPTDHFQDLRSEMVSALEGAGVEIEIHHHEVATAGQAEIDMRFDTLLRMADKLMLYKYVVKNVAWAAGKTVTFMPKPLFQDNGSGMHTHQSLWKDGDAAVLRRRQVRRAVRHGPLVHRRPAAPRPGGAGVRRADHELLQAPGARLRGAGEPRVLPAQPLRRGADPAVLEVAQGEAAGVPLPGPVLQPLPGVLGAADGRPRRRAEPHRAAHAGRQGPLRPAARGAGQGAPGAGLAAARRWPRWRRTTTSCWPAACSRRT